MDEAWLGAFWFPLVSSSPGGWQAVAVVVNRIVANGVPARESAVATGLNMPSI
jgi:hypothetical protein